MLIRYKVCGTRCQHIKTPFKQSGAVLLVSLVMLLLLTIIGLSAIDITTLDTKISANARDRSMAFDAAETALNAGGESIASDKELPNSSTPGYMTSALAAQWWKTQNDGWWGANSSQLTNYSGRHNDTNGIGYVIEQPIEVRTNGANQSVADVTLGEPKPVTRFYRITARGKGPGESVVHLQSVYARKVFLNTAQ